MHIDAVTLADLQVFHEPDGRGGLLALVESPASLAGRAVLRRRLAAPSADPEEIRRLQDAVRFFAERWTRPVFSGTRLDEVARYLRSNIDLGDTPGPIRDRACALWLPVGDREMCRELRLGVAGAAELLGFGRTLAERLLRADPPEHLRRLAERLLAVCTQVGEVRPTLSVLGTLRQDRHLRRGLRPEMEALIDGLAEVDALSAMGATTRARGWIFPEIVEDERFGLEGEGVRHPFLPDAVGNPVRITGGDPVVFLTGPNMAGKTTYMRALGLAVVLAQAGMGVPARSLRLTPVEVLVTGLEPADDLGRGLSYFLSEVLRVKEAAGHVASGSRCLVLFDEVFKGTNVRDALEASRQVISAFARSRTSGSLFSSHLTELAEPLGRVPGIRFWRFDGEVSGGRATYSFRLRPGVSRQRFGLQLLREYDVPDLLERIGEG